MAARAGRATPPLLLDSAALQATSSYYQCALVEWKRQHNMTFSGLRYTLTSVYMCTKWALTYEHNIASFSLEVHLYI